MGREPKTGEETMTLLELALLAKHARHMAKVRPDDGPYGDKAVAAAFVVLADRILADKGEQAI